MTAISSLCIYCGSRTGEGPGYRALAESAGREIAARDLTLVYGGGQIGLMGLAARAALAEGGRVVGIIPEHLDEIEIAQTGLSELHVVKDMHTRKRMMFDRADAFLVLPGGMGTLDEFIEMVTWAQIGLHDKPIMLINHDGYWEPLLALIKHVIAEGFAGPSNLDLFTVVDSLDDAFAALAAHPAPRRAAQSDLT